MGITLPQGPVPREVQARKPQAPGKPLPSEFVAKLERDRREHVARKIEGHLLDGEAGVVSCRLPRGGASS